MDKPIRVFRELPRRFFVAGRKFYVVNIDSPEKVALNRGITDGVAYKFSPNEPLTRESSWVYGGLLTSIAEANSSQAKDIPALVTSDFLEGLAVNGYHELDKLNTFMHFET